MKRKVLVVGLGAVFIAATTTSALAGHETSGVLSYTGCLVANDGVIIKVRQGDAPKSSCTGGQVQVHLSGGDITRISVGSGLVLPLGGENGDVRIELAAGQTLPSGCTGGQVVEWNGSAWVCAADDDTTYAAGTGLILTPAGPQDTDDAFSIQPDYRVKNTPDCPSGQFSTGFSSSGNIQCGTPTAPSLQTFQARQANYEVGDGVPDDFTYRPYVTLPVPAGTYMVTGKGVLRQGDDDIGFRPSSAFDCRLGNLPVEQTGFFGKDNDPDEYSFALAGIVTTSGEALTLQCSAAADLDLVSVRFATLVALRVG